MPLHQEDLGFTLLILSFKFDKNANELRILNDITCTTFFDRYKQVDICMYLIIYLFRSWHTFTANKFNCNKKLVFRFCNNVVGKFVFYSKFYGEILALALSIFWHRIGETRQNTVLCGNKQRFTALHKFNATKLLSKSASYSRTESELLNFLTYWWHQCFQWQQSCKFTKGRSEPILDI